MFAQIFRFAQNYILTVESFNKKRIKDLFYNEVIGHRENVLKNITTSRWNIKR